MIKDEEEEIDEQIQHVRLRMYFAILLAACALLGVSLNEVDSTARTPCEKHSAEKF